MKQNVTILLATKKISAANVNKQEQSFTIS